MCLFLDVHVEPQSIDHQPVDLVLLRAEPVIALAEMKNRAVIDDLPLVGAPDRVAHATGPDLVHVARDQPSGPEIRCLVIGVRSNTPQALRPAKYSMVEQ